MAKLDRTSKGWPRVLRALFWASACAAVSLCAGCLWLFVLYPLERGPGSGHAVEIVVPLNARPADIAELLSRAGLVSKPHVFSLWLRLRGGAPGVVEGAHLVSDDLSPSELLAALTRGGRSRTVRVTLPEGWTRFDMARRLQDRRVVSLRAFLDATTDASLLRDLGVEGDSVEGYLFPATYEFQIDSDPRAVVRRMKAEFDRRWELLSRSLAVGSAELTRAGLDQHEVVTLASMVEREAVADDERGIIAGVFINRLRDPGFHPKHLECDPTAAYGCLVEPERAASCSQFTGRVTAAIEHDPDNPYSTYTHEGLPPGPIANPGDKSLAAAMSPTSSRYFYFVARGEGRHVFSETYEAHLTAIHNMAALP